MDDLDEEAAPVQCELVTFGSKQGTYVYVSLPPVSTTGHRAELWNVVSGMVVACTPGLNDFSLLLHSTARFSRPCKHSLTAYFLAFHWHATLTCIVPAV